MSAVSRLMRQVAFFIMILVSSIDSLASIQLDTPIDFLDESVAGLCSMIITNDEPYSAINADCEMTKNNIRASYVQISGFDMGWPRPALPPAHFTWPTLSLFPDVNSSYCQKFGDFSLKIRLGHYDDPQQNRWMPGKLNCESPEPEANVYFQTFCLGSFEPIYNISVAIPGVHLSYRLSGSLNFCWAMAVEGSQ